MKQKKIGTTLYVFSEDPYVITEDTDANIIYIQEEVIFDFAKINIPLISKMKPINYRPVCVTDPEWAEYYNHNFELDYLTIESLADDNVIKWKQYGGESFDIQYSINKIDWITVTSTSEGQTITTLDKNEIIYIKGNYQPISNNNFGLFETSSEFKVYGNIMSLSNGDDYKNAKTIENDYQFSGLFSLCNSMKDASDLILPATTLTKSCYDGMFYNCTSLTTAPALPATTLVDSCYYSMFYGCSSLTTAPELPATTLADSCYYGMFNRCSSLTTAPELPATTSVTNCYRSMFFNCTSLNYIKCMLVNRINYDTSAWLKNVAVTGTFVKDTNATWSTGNSGIPEGWTVQDA